MEKMIRIEGVYLPLNSATLTLLEDIRVFKYAHGKKVPRSSLALPDFEIVEVFDKASPPIPVKTDEVPTDVTDDEPF